MAETIRAMVKSDVQGVYAVECTCFRTPWSKQALAGELRNDVAHYLVYECDGALCGYGGMWVLFEEAHLTNIAILPDFRKCGRARRLLLAMMELALSLGATKMTLEVREHNEVAKHLYQTLDFEQNGYRPRYYSDTGEGALLLWNMDIQATVSREREKHETV